MSERLLRLEQIIKLRECGLTYREIGRRLGISGNRVYQIVNPEIGKRPRKPAMPQHPIFVKYKREWLHEVTGFSLNYLCRIATGRMPLTPSFIEQVCLKFNQPESELFTMVPGMVPGMVPANCGYRIEGKKRRG